MRILLIGGILFFGNCKAQKKDLLTVFEKFHTQFEKKQYDSIALLLSDDFVIINEFSDVTDYKKPHLEFFSSWCNAFNTKWTVTSVAAVGDKVVSTEYYRDRFNDYTYPVPMEYRFVYTIKNNQIPRIKYDSIPGTKFYQKKQLSEERFFTFYSWLRQNHPMDKTYYVEKNHPSALRTKELLEEFLKSRK